MYRIVFELDSFNDEADPETLKHVIVELCFGLAEANARWLTVHPDTPHLYDSGVFYKDEKPGHEEFFDIPRVMRQGFADCEDLACWRAAELYVRFGIPAEPHVMYTQFPNQVLFHVQVIYTLNGQTYLEDPSIVLGMKV